MIHSCIDHCVPHNIPDCVDRHIPKTELSHCNRRMRRYFERSCKKLDTDGFFQGGITSSEDLHLRFNIKMKELRQRKQGGKQTREQIRLINKKIRNICQIAFIYKHYSETGDVCFSLKDYYNSIKNMCGGEYINMWTGKKINSEKEGQENLRVFLQEHSPSSRQYWYRYRFNETRNFPFFINPELSLCQNERNWQKGTDGLRRGGKWMCNIMLFDESTLIRLYPDLFRPVEEMRQYIENEDTTKMRHSTYNVDKDPQMLIMHL